MSQQLPLLPRVELLDSTVFLASLTSCRLDSPVVRKCSVVLTLTAGIAIWLKNMLLGVSVMTRAYFHLMRTQLPPPQLHCGKYLSLTIRRDWVRYRIRTTQHLGRRNSYSRQRDHRRTVFTRQTRRRQTRQFPFSISWNVGRFLLRRIR